LHPAQILTCSENVFNIKLFGSRSSWSLEQHRFPSYYSNTMDRSLLIALLENPSPFRTILNYTRIWPGGALKKSLQHGPNALRYPRRPHQLTSVHGSGLAAANWLQTGEPQKSPSPTKNGAILCSRHVCACSSSLKVDELAQKPADALSSGSSSVGKVRMPTLHTATVQRDCSILRRRSTKNVLNINRRTQPS